MILIKEFINKQIVIASLIITIVLVVFILLLTSCNNTAINENVVENKKDVELEQKTHNVEIREKDNEVVDKTIEKAEDETLSFELKYELTEELNNLGEITIQVGTFREINGLIVKILDANNAQLYITPDELRHYGDCGVEVKNIFIDDLNGDKLDDITIIYSSYFGAGYLGGLEFDRSYVLLQTDHSFAFDEEQHELGNEHLINTNYSNVQFYYDKHDWNNTLYTIENVELNIKKEYANITANYPQIKSDDLGLQNHTNEIIGHCINGLLYDFNDMEDYVTIDISYEVTRSDRFLSVKYVIDWYVDGTAHPNTELHTVNIDLEIGGRVYYLNIIPTMKDDIDEILSLCNGVSYAGLFEPKLSEELKKNIIDNWYIMAVNISEDKLFISIPTNQASGGYLTLSFNLSDVSEYIKYDGIVSHVNP